MCTEVDSKHVSKSVCIPLLQPTYQNETIPSQSKMSTSLNNNLSELDTLLQDLSNSRYSERRGE